jgi:hypothetical protein
MNINLRALVFGVAVAATTMFTIQTVVAAETTDRIVRLDPVEVIANRATMEAGPEVVRLEPVMVIGHRAK